MAVAPISLCGKVIGSFNQADGTKKRFQPGLDTSLLQQLAIIDVDNFKQVNKYFQVMKYTFI
jgi:hypothetical protein